MINKDSLIPYDCIYDVGQGHKLGQVTDWSGQILDESDIFSQMDFLNVAIWKPIISLFPLATDNNLSFKPNN